jgi:DNA-binding MarR family transcriptional regulator
MSTTKPPASTPCVITDLLSSRLHRLAALSSASASLRVQRKFGLTLMEWRSIGMLGAFAPLSLKDLARRAGLDKSYASRTVSGLLDRGLIASERSDVDARGVMLSLTKEGEALYRKVFPDAVARNEELLSSFSAQERVQLMEMLRRMTVSATRLLEHEHRVAAGEAVDDSAAKAPHAKSRANTAGNGVDLQEIRDLVLRLSDLVGGP